jgi:hypothetical protein
MHPKNLRDAVELIRNLGEGEDKILAYINPIEAHLLHHHFGSSTNPYTGLPQFGGIWDSIKNFFSNTLPHALEHIPLIGGAVSMIDDAVHHKSTKEILGDFGTHIGGVFTESPVEAVKAAINAGKNHEGIGKILESFAKGSLSPVLDTVKTAAPLVGSTIGTIIGGPGFGTSVGGALGTALGTGAGILENAMGPAIPPDPAQQQQAAYEQQLSPYKQAYAQQAAPVQQQIDQQQGSLSNLASNMDIGTFQSMFGAPQQPPSYYSQPQQGYADGGSVSSEYNENPASQEFQDWFAGQNPSMGTGQLRQLFGQMMQQKGLLPSQDNFSQYGPPSFEQATGIPESYSDYEQMQQQLSEQQQVPQQEQIVQQPMYLPPAYRRGGIANLRDTVEMMVYR